MRWRAGAGAPLQFGLQSDTVDFKHVTFPLPVPVSISGTGRSEVTVDTVVYYCTERSSVCYVDPIRVKIALAASPGGAVEVPVDIPVRTPPTMAVPGRNRP